MHSWCVESEKWVEICFHHWTSEKIPLLYFFLHKSWIWQTLGHVTKKFSYHHFHNASKECFWPKNFLNFMHGFKSAILAKMKNWFDHIFNSSEFYQYFKLRFFIIFYFLFNLSKKNWQRNQELNTNSVLGTKIPNTLNLIMSEYLSFKSTSKWPLITQKISVMKQSFFEKPSHNHR